MSSSRSRSRTASRSRSLSRRSRSSSRSVSRSVSRDLYRQDRIIPEAGLAKALEDQQRSIYELLQDHKREVDSKLQTKTTKFYKKNIEKQYEVVQDVKLDVKKAIDSARKKDYKKVKKILKNLKSKLQEQEENLLIADRSSNGWLTVARLRNQEKLSSKLLKEVEKIDTDLNRSRHGKTFKNYKKMEQQDRGFDGSVQTTRPPKRKAPEEAIKEAAGQTRTGACQHCQGQNHFYRECPKFWEKVIEARTQKN